MIYKNINAEKIKGNLDINSISATTISATTYLNLPLDVYVTGSTFNNNTHTFTNNTGGTFSVLFNTLTGLTINGDILITGNTEVTGDIIPTNDSTSDVGTPIKRFRDINTLSGTSTVWTSTIKVITPSLDLGLDTNSESRIINADNSIIQNDTLLGGTY